MKIIGISGATGAGKTTVTEKMCSLLPKSTVIYGDSYMKELAQTMEDKIFKQLGQAKETGVFTSNYFFQSYMNMKIFVSVIKKEMVRLIEEQIENESQNNEYIIIDWVFLPLCELFEKCDITICVEANYKKRLERLKLRLEKEIVHKRDWSVLDKYKPGTLENRVKFTALEDFDCKYTYKITNNNNLIDLFSQIDIVIDNITT